MVLVCLERSDKLAGMETGKESSPEAQLDKMDTLTKFELWVLAFYLQQRKHVPCNCISPVLLKSTEFFMEHL